MIRRLSLDTGVKEWAAAVLTAAEMPSQERSAAVAALEDSSFNIHRSVEQLYAIYCA
jgi:hypothetical protein